MPGILGKKIGMTRIMQDDGCVIPLTVVQCEPNEITYVKTAERDGYPALVLGFCKRKKPTKNKQYYFKREFRTKGEDEHKKGDQITVKIFEEREKVRITGTSKGKGFQGVIKRYNFSRGPETHGSHHHREPGSIGTCAKPGRVHKGKKLPGHMGDEKKTIRSEILYINLENNLIGIKGPIPGANNNLVIIRKLA